MSEAGLEGHHLKPLGEPHNGPDIGENILILCPNLHAQCDFAAIRLEMKHLRMHPSHTIGADYIDYHNRLFDGCDPRR